MDLIKIKENKYLIGAHMSIEGGLHNALITGAALDCTVVQLFLKSNRQWNAKILTQQDIVMFKTTAIKNNIIPIGHASYLINLGSPQKETEQKSINGLQLELDWCDQLNIDYLIIHPGSHLEDSPSNSIQRIAQNINYIYATKNYRCTLLLETMAGQGTTLGHTFEQLGEIITQIKKQEKIGICLDTCHIFAAGYQFNTAEEYEKMWNDFDRIIGLEKLKVIHINNSKKECGTRIDRHEHISIGAIPIESFKLLINDPRLQHIPKILETPKENGLEKDKENLKVLHNLIS